LPGSDTVCVPDCALSVNFNVAEREPLALGLKLTLTLQLEFCASGLAQLLVKPAGRIVLQQPGTLSGTLSDSGC